MAFDLSTARDPRFDLKSGKTPQELEDEKAPSWGKAISALPGAVPAGFNLAGKVLMASPREILQFARAVPGAIAGQVADTVQYGRNKSPEGPGVYKAGSLSTIFDDKADRAAPYLPARGTAAPMGEGKAKDHPYLEIAAAGNTAPLRQKMVDDPLSVALDAAGVLGTTKVGRAIMAAPVKLPYRAVRAGVHKINDLRPTVRAENQIMEAVRNSQNLEPIAPDIPPDTPPPGGPGAPPPPPPRPLGPMQGPPQSPGPIGPPQRPTGPMQGPPQARPMGPPQRPLTQIGPPQWRPMGPPEAPMIPPGLDIPQAEAARLAATLRAERGNVPLSMAQVTQDPGLINLERMSRERHAGSWTMFDQAQNDALYNQLRGIVNPASDEAVASAKAARTAATAPLRQQAIELADEAGFADPIRAAVEAELQGPRRVNSGVRDMAKWLLDEDEIRPLADAGATVEARGEIKDALNKSYGRTDLGNAINAAGKSARNIKTAIDDALDHASGGVWSEYLRAFARESGGVNNLEALNKIRAELDSMLEGGALHRGARTPVLTRANINRIIEKHRYNKYGNAILPEVQAKLDQVRRTAQRIESGMRAYRMASTGGGGSDTIPRLMSALAQSAAHTVIGGKTLGTAQMIGKYISGLGEAGGSEMLARMLQRPEVAAEALAKAAKRDAARRGVKPPTDAELAKILAATRKK